MPEANSEALKNDASLSEVGIFCSLFYRFFLAKGLEYTFWPYAMESHKWYSPEVLIDEINESSLSATKVADWCREWIEQQPKELQEGLQNELLMKGSIFHRSISMNADKHNAVNPDIIRLMMYDMNLLECSPKD